MNGTQQKVSSCSCQLCNPTYADQPAPSVKKSADTEWTIVRGKTGVVMFHGKVVANKATTLAENLN